MPDHGKQSGSARYQFLIFAVVLVATSTALQADESGGSGRRNRMSNYIGARVGYLEIEDVDEGDLNIGVMGGYGLHRHAALAGALEYHSADFDLEDRSTFALTAGVEVYFFKEKVAVQPYLVGGIGYYHSEVRRTDDYGEVIIDDIDYEVGFHAGAGLDINCCSYEGERFLINLELRKIFSDPEENREEVEPDGTQITLGLKVKLKD